MSAFRQNGLRATLSLFSAITISAGSLRAQGTPTFTNVSVHDPSVVRVGSTYYVFGSHLASASTTDLMNWTQITTSVAYPNSLIRNQNPQTEFAEALTWAQTTDLWAPDVIKLGDGKYYFYYCACQGSSPLSALGLAVSDAITGPYANVGILLKSGMVGLSPDGTNYNVNVHPNVIDPSVFFDNNGKLWMVYGSFSGGIFIMQLDSTIGSATIGQPILGQGYGKKLIGGNSSRIEGSYIIYSPETSYYYLFCTFGGLDAAGGYNIRVGRSLNPDGPYLDAAGNDLTNVKGNFAFDDATIAPYGVKLMGNRQFLHAASDPQTTSRGYVSPGGVSINRDSSTGKYVLVFHTRFVGQGEYHEVRVHQLYLNADGWFVAAPHRYAQETISATIASQIPGDFKLINHGKDITATVKTSTIITLNTDGSVTGTTTGSWLLSSDHYATLTLAGTSYHGVFSRQWDDDNQMWVLTFSALSVNGVAVWGSKLTALPATTTPAITIQPVSQSVIAGSPVTFTAAAGGNPSPTFQWQKGGVNLSGATSSSFTIASVAAGDAGNYTVVATNSTGSITSNIASLTVAAAPVAPTITTQPVSQTVAAGKPVTFTVAASGTPTPGFQWKKGGVNLSGATSSSFTIASVAAGDAGSYTAVVTNSAGSVTSVAATLTVITSHGAMDFNLDGQSDLVWQNNVTGERSIWLMNGATVTQGVSLGLSPTEWSIAAIADFNGDGKPDLLWQNTLTGDRVFWLMNGPNFISSVDLGVTSPDWSIAAAADFNGDGQPDILLQNTSTGDRQIWLMNGTTVGSTVAFGTYPPEWSIAATGDFNGDGQPDLLWQNTVTGEKAVWLINGTTLTAGVALGTSPKLLIAGTGDYNGDGQPDILWTNTSTGERGIWLMNGTTVASTVSLGVVDQVWTLIGPVFRRALSDFNNDGKSDLVWQNTATGDRAVWLMNGTAARTGLSLGNYPTNQWIAAIGDFNNDGYADLVWQNRSTGDTSIWLMNGTTILSKEAVGTFDPTWSIATTGDFNGDGKPDLVWQNATTGEAAIWLMDGTAFTGGVSLGIVSTQLQIVGTGDFNGDGQTDIVWQNTSTGERHIWFMNGTAFASNLSIGTYDPAWSIVGTGDYNGDGKPDLLWQNTVTGDRVVWLMDGTTFINSVDIGIFDTAWSIRN
jgi:beta-xylosidase